jgi:hypothetical protein
MRRSSQPELSGTSSGREASQKDLPLLLMAASHLHGESDACPVCLQSMAGAPERRSLLLSLQATGDRVHLQRATRDLDLALVEELLVSLR